MKIIIAGGSGFLGKALKQHWKEEDVITLTRNQTLGISKGYQFWNGASIGDWVKILENADVLINLSGKSVNCRYTEKNKAEIIASRTQSTKVLAEAIRKLKKPPKLLINASSATIYRHAEDRPMTEAHGELGKGFSVEVCKAWEKEFFSNSLTQTRQACLRTALVFGREGSTYPVFKGLVKKGLGGTQGSGNQFVSWIHIQDFLKAVDFIIKNETMNGVINISAPIPITNAVFMKALRKSLNVPFGLRLYPWMVKLGMECLPLLGQRN